MGKAKDWVEGNVPSAEGHLKALLILTYGAGLDAGLAEAQELLGDAMNALVQTVKVQNGRGKQH